MPSSIRKPQESDLDWIAQSIRLAYKNAGGDWGEEAIAQKLAAEQGVTNADDKNHVYAVAEAYEIPHEVFGVVPAGLSTHVKDLLPQHHNQEWIDGPILAALAPCLREVAKKTPEALDKHLWAFVAYDLAIPYWRNSIIKADVKRSRSGGNALAYVSTLRLAIERLEAAGL